jgi:O-antigen/teichoic acid export membrane protein
VSEPAPPPPPSGRSSSRSGTRVIASNSGWQLLTFFARAASGLAATILLARNGGPAELGIFQFTLTLSLMLSFLVGWGFTNFLTREVARRPQDGVTWVESGILYSLSSGAVLTGVVAVVTLLLGVETRQAHVVVIACAALAFDNMGRIEFSLFWAWERMGLESFATCVQEGAFALGTVLTLHLGYGVEAVMLCYLASRMLGAAIGWTIASRGLHRILMPRYHRGFLPRTLRRSVPFAIDDALSLTYIRADTVLLGFIRGDVAVGFYQAGTNLVLYLNVLARMLNYPLFPRMSKAWPDQPTTFGRLRDASLRLLGALGVPIMVGSLLLASRIITFLYGPRFEPAVFCYQVLVLVIPIRMLGHTLGTALTAADGQTERTTAVTAAAIANLLLNLWFIPHYSYVGAAFTTGITESGLFLAYGGLLRRRAGRSAVIPALGLPALACVPMALVLVLISSAPLFVAIALGAATYVASMTIVTLLVAPKEARGRPRDAVLALVRPPTPVG